MDPRTTSENLRDFELEALEEEKTQSGHEEEEEDQHVTARE